MFGNMILIPSFFILGFLFICLMGAYIHKTFFNQRDQVAEDAILQMSRSHRELQAQADGMKALIQIEIDKLPKRSQTALFQNPEFIKR